MKTLMLVITAMAFSLCSLIAGAGSSQATTSTLPTPPAVSTGQTLHALANSFSKSYTNFVIVNVFHYCNPSSPPNAFGQPGCVIPRAVNKPTCPKGATLITRAGTSGAIPLNSLSSQSNTSGYIWYTCSEKIPSDSSYLATLQGQSWTTCENPLGGDNPAYQCALADVTVNGAVHPLYRRPPVVNFVARIDPQGATYNLNPGWSNGGDGIWANHWSAVELQDASSAYNRMLYTSDVQIDVYGSAIPGGVQAGHGAVTDNSDAQGYLAGHNAQAAWVYDSSTTPVLLSGNTSAQILIWGPTVSSTESVSSISNNDGTWGYYFCTGDDYGTIFVEISYAMLGQTCTYQCPDFFFWMRHWNNIGTDHWASNWGSTASGSSGTDGGGGSYGGSYAKQLSCSYQTSGW